MLENLIPNPNFRELTEETPAVWDEYPIASWTVMGSAVLAFPAIEITETGGSRIIRRERAYRNGVKCDDTGSLEKGWDIIVKFSNEIAEPGLEDNGMPLYPDVLRALVETSDLYHEEAGDLILPHRGPVRARFDRYRWIERADERNCASLLFQFVEDNEDNVDAASYSFPSVQANATQLALDVMDLSFDLEAFNDMLLDLQDLADDLASLAMAPTDARTDFENQANLFNNTIDSIINSFSQAGQDGVDQFTVPESDAAVRTIIVLKDTVARSISEARRGRPKLVSVVFSSNRSIMSIANEFSQSYTDLLEVNSTLNPMLVPAGTPVKIFEVT